jgi:hypothetical protein
MYHVVLAKAGTHTPCRAVFGTGVDAFYNYRSQGLWVPACAGTTQHSDFRITKAHFPFHAGFRFSPNALRPSLASSVIAVSAIWLSV